MLEMAIGKLTCFFYRIQTLEIEMDPTGRSAWFSQETIGCGMGPTIQVVLVRRLLFRLIMIVICLPK